MRPQPLRTILEALGASSEKRFAGAITDPDQLLAPGRLESLDAKHRGSYAIFVYDPAVDTGLSTYLSGTALRNDTTRDVLALYEPVPQTAKNDELSGLGLEVTGASPVTEFARGLFPGQQLVAPGLVVVGRLTSESSAVYVSLTGNDGVAERVREVLADVARATHPGADDVLDGAGLGRALAQRGVAYLRSERISVREGFLKLLRGLWDHRSDVLTVISTAASVAGAGG